MSTTNSTDDRFDDVWSGLEWLEKPSALQARSASDQAAYEVAKYIKRLRTGVPLLSGNRTRSELSESVGKERAGLVVQQLWNDGMKRTHLDGEQLCPSVAGRSRQSPLLLISKISFY